MIQLPHDVSAFHSANKFVSQELIKIASFGTETEAELYCSILRERGIQSFVQQAAISTLFGNNALMSNVELHASPDDAEAAIEILESAHEADPKSTPWYCHDCDETIEAGFQVCWSCGKDRPDGASQPPIATVVEEEGSFTDDNHRDDEPQRKLTNPYATPESDSRERRAGSSDRNAGVAEDPVDRLAREWQDEVAEDHITRAYRGALIGLFLFPILMNLYSLYLLAITTSAKRQLSSRWKQTWNIAFVIDIAAICVWAYAFRVMMR